MRSPPKLRTSLRPRCGARDSPEPLFSNAELLAFVIEILAALSVSDGSWFVAEGLAASVVDRAGGFFGLRSRCLVLLLLRVRVLLIRTASEKHGDGDQDRHYAATPAPNSLPSKHVSEHFPLRYACGTQRITVYGSYVTRIWRPRLH
jgi:hypothetical protein